MRKLKTTEIKAYRETQLQKQNGLCGLCEEQVAPEEAVLDHDHKSGRVRQVLHRGCNVIEGVIANNVKRNKVTPDRLAKICDNLIEYLNTAETDLLHPTHKEPGTKRKRRNGNKNKQSLAGKP